MIVAGFGFRAGAGLQSLRDALEETGRAAEVTDIATVADKAHALRPLADTLGLAVHAVPLSELQEQETTTRSVASLAARAVGSVAEAAALAAAGPGARLVISRRISEDRAATCAIAEGPGQ